MNRTYVYLPNRVRERSWNDRKATRTCRHQPTNNAWKLQKTSNALPNDCDEGYWSTGTNMINQKHSQYTFSLDPGRGMNPTRLLNNKHFSCECDNNKY